MANGAVSPLGRMKEELVRLGKKGLKLKYFVPTLWGRVGEPCEIGGKPVAVNPSEYFLGHIEAIEKNRIPDIVPTKSLNGQLPNGNGGAWIANETIYNMFVRLTTAYDHNQDGKLGGDKRDVTLANGVRESGTFLKAIAMLGYVRSLGCSVIHLLPITSIGKDGNKGELGSPYAIRNPYAIEDSLGDLLINMSAEEQFKAFVEACHLLGIRVICEFVFRTASKDSDWVKENPDWFYWIDEKVKDRNPGETNLEKAKATYGNPIFDGQTLKLINKKVAAQDFTQLPSPPEAYQDFFKPAPKKSAVKFNKKGQFRATTKGLDGKTYSVRIPGAFADWPPDDNQPPWGDVTYLRMYKDSDPKAPKFNYIAYNTIRMYDKELAKPELASTELWNTIINLVPTYQAKYGIDGVMVDMGHAVPVELMQKLVEKARSIDPNFCFLSENFEIGQDSVEAGYNAVVGYCWWVEYRRDGMYEMLEHLGNQGVPLSFFGATENHNTPRAAARNGGVSYAKYAFLVNSMLPRAIPFIHSGQELGETAPVNTGLDFANEDLASLKGQKLALFDLCAYNWDAKTDMLDFFKKVLGLRQTYKKTVTNTHPESFCKLLTGHSDVIAFIRRDFDHHLMVMFNRDYENSLASEIDLSWCLPQEIKELKDKLEGSTFEIKYKKLKYNLKPGQAVFFAW